MKRKYLLGGIAAAAALAAGGVGLDAAVSQNGAHAWLPLRSLLPRTGGAGPQRRHGGVGARDRAGGRCRSHALPVRGRLPRKVGLQRCLRTGLATPAHRWRDAHGLLSGAGTPARCRDAQRWHPAGHVQPPPAVPLRRRQTARRRTWTGAGPVRSRLVRGDRGRRQDRLRRRGSSCCNGRELVTGHRWPSDARHGAFAPIRVTCPAATTSTGALSQGQKRGCGGEQERPSGDCHHS